METPRALTIDLRSDTVTVPTPAMRAAMAQAEVGDDVYHEDPTVNRLEERAAAITGKEAALFVPSGTMGNLIALMVHCPRGTKAIVGSRAHTWRYEAGGLSVLGGAVLAPVANCENGDLDLAELDRELAVPNDHHFARPAVIALENTHNDCGGAPVALSHQAAVKERAQAYRLAMHLDGARIFNAALALETSVREIAAPADSVTFCLSKGLCCPVGSLLCGSRAFIEQAHRLRKALGGGMRQAGIVAAAGLYALDHLVDRLAEDHLNAAYLAAYLGRFERLSVRAQAMRTNMVFFQVEGGRDQADDLNGAMRELGLLVGRRADGSFRAVTHYGIDRHTIDRAADLVGRALASLQ